MSPLMNRWISRASKKKRQQQSEVLTICYQNYHPKTHSLPSSILYSDVSSILLFDSHYHLIQIKCHLAVFIYWYLRFSNFLGWNYFNGYYCFLIGEMYASVYLFSEIILKFTNRFAYLMLKTIEYKYILVTNHSEAYYRKHYLLTIYRQPKSKNVNILR